MTSRGAIATLGFVVAVGALGLLPACGQQEGPSASGTKTEWLRECEASEECPTEAECLCGICTAECTSDDDCAPGVCSPEDSPSLCGGEAIVGRVCLPVEKLPFSELSAPTSLSVPGATALDDPSFTGDRLELYFAVETETEPSQIWRARRETESDAWGPAELVPELVPETDSANMPGVTADGLTLYLVQHPVLEDRYGRRDLYVSRRSDRSAPWSTPTPVLFESDPSFGASPTGTSDGLLLVWTLKVDGTNSLLQARRESVEDPWESLGVIEEIMTPGVPVYEPWISDDGLLLFYRSGDDIYETWRASRDEAFGPPTRVDELNTDAYEGDPWLSPDGRHIMFSSERDGALMLYEASR